MSTIAVLGTFDTKGLEHAFVADQIRRRGHRPLLIDVGTFGSRSAVPDFPATEIAMAGGSMIDGLRLKNDREHASTVMSTGAAAVLRKLVTAGKIHAVISLGGVAGTQIGTTAMRALPLGFPKVMVSTVTRGDVSRFVDVSDIVMIPSIVDVAGLNRISRPVLVRAVGAVCGMSENEIDVTADKPVIAASVIDETADCVSRARVVLEAAGYELILFRADGKGGRTMESLIEAGMIDAVLDVTTAEWADEVLGGILGAGPTRLEAAARNGIPAVIAPGCLDLCRFGAPQTLPEKYRSRRLHPLNPDLTLMRTDAEECAEIAKTVAEKINLSTAPVSLMLPKRGISLLGAPGLRLHDPIADKVLFQALRAYLRDEIPIYELDSAINDRHFAESCAHELLANIGRCDPGKNGQ